MSKGAPKQKYTSSELAGERLLRYKVYADDIQPYLDWQLSILRGHIGDRILEIGCGIGCITKLLGERELILALDVENDVLDYARESLSDRDYCRFALLDITKCNDSQLAELRDHHFDTVVCINVLEHIQHDDAALRAMYDVLEPGGKLLLLVPAHPLLYGRYDAVDGHYRRYSKRGLQALVGKTGFQVRVFRFFNALGAIGWFVEYRILRREAHGSGSVRLMSRLMPWLRRFENVIPPIFGISIIAVCEKPRPE
ncbi:MAG: methyltransferase [Armatimonadota bacterium]|nr:methyltransferase [Armatimonadota bacterium]